MKEMKCKKKHYKGCISKSKSIDFDQPSGDDSFLLAFICTFLPQNWNGNGNFTPSSEVRRDRESGARKFSPSSSLSLSLSTSGESMYKCIWVRALMVMGLLAFAKRGIMMLLGAQNPFKELECEVFSKIFLYMLWFS
jgi:hypothetical protein